MQEMYSGQLNQRSCMCGLRRLQIEEYIFSRRYDIAEGRILDLLSMHSKKFASVRGVQCLQGR